MTTAIQSVKPGRKPGLLINRNYSLLFVGQTISLLGDQISTYTLILWLVDVIAAGQSWAPLAVSALFAASIVPNLLVGPLAGVFVDRWDHRVTMIRSDAIRAVLWLFLIAFTGVIPLSFLFQGASLQLARFIALCAVTFMSNVCSQFFGPATTGLLGQIVPDELWPQASGWNQTMRASATIVGPLLAAPLFFLVGIQWALLIDALSFVVSLVTIWAIQAPTFPQERRARSDLRSEFVAGVRFSLGNATVRAIIVSSFIATFGAGAFDALFVFFLVENLHVSTSLIGLVVAVFGSGMIIGALLAGKIARRVGLKRLIYLSLFGSGVGMIILSRLTSFVPALVLFFLLGVCPAALRVASSPLLLKETPRDMIGRVSAVLGPSSMIASLISTIVAGYLVGVLLSKLHLRLLGTVFAPVDTVFILVGLLFFLSALYTFYTLPGQSARSTEQTVQER